MISCNNLYLRNKRCLYICNSKMTVNFLWNMCILFYSFAYLIGVTWITITPLPSCIEQQVRWQKNVNFIFWFFSFHECAIDRQMFLNLYLKNDSQFWMKYVHSILLVCLVDWRDLKYHHSLYHLALSNQSLGCRGQSFWIVREIWKANELTWNVCPTKGHFTVFKWVLAKIHT